MYEGEDYDLAGFCVGVVEKDEIIDGSKVSVGDKLIALPSSGPHSNGYSLIRKIIEVRNADLSGTVDGKPLTEALMEPTRIYVKPVLELIKKSQVNALSHITGGGLLENIPRVLPQSAKAVIDINSWQMPEVFRWIQTLGNVDSREMYRTLNCGIGMVIVVPADTADVALQILKDAGEAPFIVGEIAAASAGEEQVQLLGLEA
jgi:phosphoribosylformylglycinamidine cyclo-ligase